MRYSFSDLEYILPANPLVVSMSLSSNVYRSLRTEISALNRDLRASNSKYNALAATLGKPGLPVESSAIHSSRSKSPQVQWLLPSGNYMSDASTGLSGDFADGKSP
jgi:DNA-binding winged helix-turn-helix (wHTH) protein